MNFCEEVRQESNELWEASFSHPFVKGIIDGTLHEEKFKMYLLQDTYYLKHYTKLLSLAATKAERYSDVQFFLESARYVHESELSLHRTVLQEFHVSQYELDQLQPAPSAYHYVNHMLNAANYGDIGDLFAAMLPCPWLYQEIGERFAHATPQNPFYRDWIEMYSSDQLKQKVELQKQMMNTFAAERPDKIETYKLQFTRSCYYEWKFWEMSWTMENWNKEVLSYELI